VLKGGEGIPELYWSGTEGEYNVMAIELLGPNVEELMRFCYGSLSQSSVIALVGQLVSRIEHVHNKGYIHRDIKPDNFMLGREKQYNVVYLIDYGLSKRYKDPITRTHIPYRNNKKLTGTARYASLNTHLGIEQSRRDDLECLAYSLIFMVKGSLPWQGMRIEDKKVKYEKMCKKKKAISSEILCKGLPGEFRYLLHYCRSLKFEDKLDYEMLKEIFSNLFYKKGYNKKFDYDWNILKLDFDLLLNREYDNTRSKEVSREDKREGREKLVTKGTIRKEENMLVRYTSSPDNLKSPFRRPRKLPAFLITKKIKEMKQQFLAMGKQKESQEEIPDENIGSVNKVREFACAKNCIYRVNIKKPRRNRNLSWDCGSSIMIHKNKISDNIYNTIKNRCSMTPKPTKRVVKRIIKYY